MTVQVDSQPVTEQIMRYINMCCINNSISCLEKKTTLGTNDQTCYVALCVCLLRLEISTLRNYRCAPELCDLIRACYLGPDIPVQTKIPVPILILVYAYALDKSHKICFSVFSSS